MHLTPRYQTVWNLVATLVDTLVVGCVTLFYDGIVIAIVFGIEFARHGKSANKPSETVNVLVMAGLVVGASVAGGLLLNKKYYWALAILVGLLPLALFAQLVHALSASH